MRGAGKRNAMFKVRLKDGKPGHGFLALLIGQASKGCWLRGLAHRSHLFGRWETCP